MLFFMTFSFANDISYNFDVNNKTPYQNEAILLDVNISQENHTMVMLFKFNLKKSKAYSFYQVDFKESDEYHDLKHQYKYLIYPKKSGELSLEFEMTKSLTDDDKVAYAISGDRDNVKGLVKKDMVVGIDPLKLSVKPLPKATELVGDFKLSYELDKNSTDAYDPVHLKVLLEGKGDIPTLSLLPKSKLYHLFTQEPKVKLLHHSKGTSAKVEWDYAISAKESFVLPKVALKAFNPLSKKSYNLIIPSQAIEVKPVAVESLVDAEDAPPLAKGTDWSWLGWLFSYVAVFVAGFLTPRDIVKRRWSKNNLVVVTDEVADAKTHKELLKILLARHNVNDKEAIRLLEDSLYRGKKVSLAKIKAMI